MNHKACDTLGLNLFDAERQWGCRLKLGRAKELIEFVSERYGTEEFGMLLDRACDHIELEGNERHGYKMALGLFFGARAQVKLLERREAMNIPFAPR